MSREPEIRRSRQPAARALPLFPGGARTRWSSASSCGAPFCANSPQIVAVELPDSLEDAYLQALAAAAGNVGDPLYRDPKDDERGVYVPVEPAIRSPRPSAPAHEIGAEVIFLEPDLRRPPAPARPIPIPTRSATSASTSISRPIACSRRTRNEEIAAHAAAMAWKLQGTDPIGTRLRGSFAESARPAARRDGDAAGPAAARRGPAEIAAAESASRIAWPRSPSSIPYLQDATNFSGWTWTPGESRSTGRRVQFDLLREAENRVHNESPAKSRHTGSGA